MRRARRFSSSFEEFKEAYHSFKIQDFSNYPCFTREVGKIVSQWVEYMFPYYLNISVPEQIMRKIYESYRCENISEDIAGLELAMLKPFGTLIRFHKWIRFPHWDFPATFKENQVAIATSSQVIIGFAKLKRVMFVPSSLREYPSVPLEHLGFFGTPEFIKWNKENTDDYMYQTEIPFDSQTLV